MSDRTIGIGDVGDKVPDLSTLPHRMRYAATVLEEVSTAWSERSGCELYGLPCEMSWTAQSMSNTATRWEDEDRSGDELVSELAPLLSAICDEALAKDRGYVYVARRLIESGWRKGDPE